MEKAISNDVLKILIIMFAGSIGVYLFMISLTKKLFGASKRLLRKQNLYLLLGALIFGLIGLTSHPAVFSRPGLSIILYQAFFLGLGILHHVYMPRILPMDQIENSFPVRLAFTLTLSLFGCLLFVLAFRLFNREGYHLLMAGSILFFFMPLLVYQTFRQALAMPPRITKHWHYPVHQRVAEPDEKNLKNMLLVSFAIQKKLSDGHVTSFRARAPSEMPFGDLFYYFINDFNEKYPEDKIQYMNESGIPQDWVFVKKTKWYSWSKKYIDADASVSKNQLKENDVIICQRID